MVTTSDITAYCVLPEAKVQEVLKVLQSPLRICIVIDAAGKVLGTITDGDCRRAFLRKNSLEITAAEIMNRDFVVVDTSFSLEQSQILMKTNGVEQIPVVDEKNKLVDIVCSARIPEQRKSRTNPVLILAGGKGQRLRPLTEGTPKPMLPVGGRPMLERLLTQLVDQGFEEFFISVNYLGHRIQEYFGDGSKWSCRISYVQETTELGTAGPLRLIEDRVSKPVLILNGDLLTTVEFGSIVDYHMRNRNDFTLAVSQSAIQIPYGVVSVDPKGKVTRIREKPLHTFTINAGIYVINPELIARIPKDQHVPMTDVILELVNTDRKVSGFPILQESWLDIGLPEQYVRAQTVSDTMPLDANALDQLMDERPKK